MTRSRLAVIAVALTAMLGAGGVPGVPGVPGVLGMGGTPAIAAAGAPAQWAQEGYGAGRNFYNPQESVVNTSTIKKLKQKWTLTPAEGEPGCSAGGFSARVVDGRVFTIDGTGVAAFDAKSGKRLWSAPDLDYISAGLVVSGGSLIVNHTRCHTNSDWDGHVRALDVKTGKLRWSTSGSWMVDTVVADAGVLAVSGYCGICSDYERGVIGYRISDGARLWSHDNVVLGSPVSAGGRVLLKPTDSRSDFVAAIGTGKSLYEVGAGWTPVAASPAGDRFFLRGAPGIEAVDAKNGKRLWTVRKEKGDLATDGARVYVASANRVNAYDAKKGRLLWTRPVTDPERLVRAGGLLYVTTGSETLWIISPSTGKPVTKGAAYSPAYDVVVAGGRLYAFADSTMRAYAP